ncbi:preprotein translocase subunit SecG [Corynebacterium urogenitale]|uniref:Protein-export membrane protein SecG n=1 Tax=Corynebacterium urogenitale TaxID=2487892 RepID=A0A5J6Z9K2_9CORY|nr:preprotein translocase subunit SecG [Corynebacterium urogenitale]QFQ02385.1 preprotein translocase subunit SecG [Corynebacterium urogenitale]
MILTLQIILVLASLLMGLSVLLHKGKGGGLSSLFGGGMQSNLSGSTVAEKNLDRLTVVTALIWLFALIALNLLY